MICCVNPWSIFFPRPLEWSIGWHLSFPSSDLTRRCSSMVDGWRNPTLLVGWFGSSYLTSWSVISMNCTFTNRSPMWRTTEVQSVSWGFPTLINPFGWHCISSFLSLTLFCHSSSISRRPSPSVSSSSTRRSKHSRRPIQASIFSSAGVEMKSFSPSSSWPSSPIHLADCSSSSPFDYRCSPWEKRVRPRTSDHSPPSALLAATLHFCIYLRLSGLGKQLASPLSHRFLLDLLHTTMDELCLVHLSFVLLFEWMAKNESRTMDKQISASTIITTANKNIHGLLRHTRHRQRTALTKRDSDG